MGILYRPKTGEVIKADTINAIIDRLESITPKGDGKTIQVKRNPSGTTITSFAGTTGTALVPILVGEHLIYDQTAQKMIYKGFYCSDFDGIFCNTWVDCYLTTLYNIPIDDYDPNTPEIYDFPENTIFFGQVTIYDLDYDPSYPLYVFDHARWLK